MRRFFTQKQNITDEQIVLQADETKHLRDVLRLRAKEKVRVFDGESREYVGEIESIERSATRIKIIGEITPTPKSALDLTLAVALLKGEKFDLVVQKAVELGVSRLVPLLTERCDVKIRDARDFLKKAERLNRIALEACKQSGRADLMKIADLTDFQNFIAAAEENDGEKILFAEKDGAQFSSLKNSRKLCAVVGSEGGWTDAEISAAREQDFQIVTLGGRIMRAETAAVSIAAILQHRFGDLK